MYSLWKYTFDVKKRQYQRQSGEEKQFKEIIPGSEDEKIFDEVLNFQRKYAGK